MHYPIKEKSKKPLPVKEDKVEPKKEEPKIEPKIKSTKK